MRAQLCFEGILITTTVLTTFSKVLE